MSQSHEKSEASAKYKWIGTRPDRPDGADKVTGRARFGADFNLPGQLIGKVLRSPHPHAIIESIDTSKAEALAGVKAVVTSKDFPEQANLIVPTGEMQVNLRDITRNVMAREKVLYEGHPVAAVAATTEAIAKAALALIKVEYKILPHVIDVADAMKPDAPVLHDHMLTEGANPPATKPSNIAKRIEFKKGDTRGGLRRGRGRDREGLHHAGRPPGLYRAARRAGERQRGRPGPGLVDDAGSLPGARLLRQAPEHRHLADPRDADRDRRRLRRQDRGLSRAAGDQAVAEDRQAGEDDHDARGGVPRLRPGSGRHRQGQDRRQEGRPHRRRRMHGRDAGGRLPGLAGRAGLHVRLRLLRHRQHPHRGLRRRQQPAQGRGLSRARRADLGVGRRVDARYPGAAAQDGSDRPAPEERREEGHQDRLRRHLQHHRPGRDAGSRQELGALPDAAEAGLCARHRGGLLVQHRRGLQCRGRMSARTDRSP